MYVAYLPETVGGSGFQRWPYNLIDNHLIDDHVHHVAVEQAEENIEP